MSKVIRITNIETSEEIIRAQWIWLKDNRKELRYVVRVDSDSAARKGRFG